MDTASSTPSVDTTPPPASVSTPDVSTPIVPMVTTPAPTSPKSGGSWSGLIGILLIVCVITVGAFYAWGERMALQETTTPPDTRGE
ncbi:MAG: hypothetical protein AAB901_01080 [Patescibacteria group bacterium]